MYSTLFIFLSFFSFLALENFLHFKVGNLLSQQIRKYTTAVTICFFTVAFYILSFIFKISTIQYFTYVLAAVLVFQTKLYRIDQLKIFYKRQKLFLWMALGWFVLTIPAEFNEFDEFFWAAFVKHLTIYDTYWTNQVILENARYIPGFSLWEKFFVGPQFNEQALLFSIGLIFIAGFCALKPAAQSFKTGFLAFLFYSAVIYPFSSIGIGSIYVDTSVGVLFGLSLASIFDGETKTDLFATLGLVAFMGICKETSFLFGLLCVGILVIKFARQKKLVSSFGLILLGGLVFMFFNFFLWQRHLQSVGLSQAPAESSLLALKADFLQVSARTIKTLDIFYSCSLTCAFPIIFESKTFDWLHLRGTVLIDFLAIGAAFLYFRKRFEFAVGYFLGFAGYTVVLLIFWLYVTSEYEGFILASYRRYYGTFFLAFGLLLYRMAIEQKLIERKNFRVFSGLFLLCFFPNPKMFRPASLKKIVSPSLAQMLHLDQSINRDSVKPMIQKVLSQTPNDSKLWIIWQGSDGFEIIVSRLELAPRLLPRLPSSLGDPYKDHHHHENGDPWTVNLTIDEFQKNLDEIDYVVLGHIDSNFQLHYASLFMGAIRENGIYKKVFDREKLKLSLVEE